jgi:glycosyltransferase involved in cell wall biosynthesis
MKHHSASDGPLVSVIIPAFNRANVIKRAIRSVAAQSFRDFDVIVIDDGSTDATEAAVKEVSFPSLRIVKHSGNRGAAAARNTGITEATGRFIAFLDSDDIWNADKLARQISALERVSANIKACATGYQLYKADRHLTVRPELKPIQFKTDILFGCTISPGTTLMIERLAFDQIGPFDETLRYLEDWDWLLRFVERFDVLILPDPLATVYFTPALGQVTSDKEDPVLLALETIKAKHLPRLSARHDMASRKFRSTILLETGAQMYRKRRLGSAIRYVLASLWVYPFRNVAFYRSMCRSLMSFARPQPHSSQIA